MGAWEGQSSTPGVKILGLAVWGPGDGFPRLMMAEFM